MVKLGEERVTMEQKTHETQSTDKNIIEQKSTYIDEQLNPLQQIEAGGPPKKWIFKACLYH